MRVPQRIAISGSSGLIGTALVGHLKSEGHTVQRLVRRAPVASDEVQWDPQTGFVDLAPLSGVDAIIHLAGAGVGDKRWTKKFKSEILNSRLLGTTELGTTDSEVRRHLSTMWGVETRDWQLIAKYEIPAALPLHEVGKALTAPTKISENLYVAGDHRTVPSQQGALFSGSLAAQLILN